MSLRDILTLVVTSTLLRAEAQCTLKCQHDCPTMSQLPPTACGSVEARTDGQGLNMTVTWRGSKSIIQWAAHDTGEILSVPVVGRPRRRLCYNITYTEQQPTEMETVCEQLGDRRGDEVFLLDSQHSVLASVASKERTRPRQRKPRRNLHHRPECLIPDRVRVEFDVPYGVTVVWTGVVTTGVTVAISNMDDVSEHLFKVTLSKREARRNGSYYFNSFDPPPGNYTAVVGERGCSKYRHSGIFSWPHEELPAVRSRLPRGLCTCWRPEQVIVGHTNTTVTVKWSPRAVNRDLLVGIVLQNNPSVFKNQTRIASYETKSQAVLDMSLDPGATYIALVGSLDCDRCMVYRESQPLIVPLSPADGTRSEAPAPENNKKPSDRPMSPEVIRLIVLGTFAMIGIIGVGVWSTKLTSCCWDKDISRKTCSHYSPIQMPNSPSNVSNLSEVTTVTVLLDPEDEDSINSSERLRASLEERGVRIEQHPLATFIPTGREELVIHIKASECLRPPASQSLSESQQLYALSQLSEPQLMDPQSRRPEPRPPDPQCQYPEPTSHNPEFLDSNSFDPQDLKFPNPNPSTALSLLPHSLNPDSHSLEMQPLLSESQRVAKRLGNLTERTVTIQIHRDGEAICQVPLGLSLPGETQSGGVVPNRKRNIPIEEFVACIGKTPNEGRIYLLASGGDDNHEKICNQFAAILREVCEHVVFAGDSEHLAAQRANKVEWTHRQVTESDVIIALASEELISCLESPEQSSVSCLTNLCRISIDHIGKMDPSLRVKKVMVVCLGYCTEEAAMMKTKHYPGSKSFTLVQHVQGQGHVLNLHPLLSTLNMNTELVSRVCADSHQEFMNTVTMSHQG